jgi:thiosulfate/3-mercaptopyruvate sulfurtransferase
MTYSTIIAANELRAYLDDPIWIVADCRFDLAHKTAGFRAYLTSHIPGAMYVDLEKELSGPPLTDRGRHPMPSPDALRQSFGRLGISPGCQVVAYDDAGGAYAARLWWLLRYMGHEAVAVLDGSWQEWQRQGLATRSGIETRPPSSFDGQPRREWLVLLNELDARAFLVDVRDPARYRGEVEPIDRVPGHIPGAVNFPYKRCLDGAGRFLSPAKLRYELEPLLALNSGATPVVYCGSGVTACHLLLALAHAGLRPGKLYAGSWSEWSGDPSRPVASGGLP